MICCRVERHERGHEPGGEEYAPDNVNHVPKNENLVPN